MLYPNLSSSSLPSKYPLVLSCSTYDHQRFSFLSLSLNKITPFKESMPRSKSGDHIAYYHCDRGHKYYGVKKKDFEDNVYSFIDRIRFSDIYYEKLKKFLTLQFRSKINELNNGHTELNEEIIKMREKFRHFKQKDRDRIHALYTEGHFQKSIADILGVSPSAISRELHRYNKKDMEIQY